MHLINGPVPVSKIAELIAKAGENQESGAHSLFLGQVSRDQNEGKYIRAIEYSAFEEMVIMEANKINKSILSEFKDIKSIEVLHSKGLVRTGEIFLLVMVSSGHRQDAINACSKAVKLIREKLPILKKELFEDNS